MRELSFADLTIETRNPEQRLESVLLGRKHQVVRLLQSLLHGGAVGDHAIGKEANTEQEHNVLHEQQ